MAGGDKRNRTASQTAALVDAKVAIRQLRASVQYFKDGAISSDAAHSAIERTTGAVHNGLEAYEARLADLQELVADTKQELIRVDSRPSEPTTWRDTSLMAHYADLQDRLAEAEERKSPLPAALVNLLEDTFRVHEANEAVAAGKEIPADMEEALAAQARTYASDLDYCVDNFPQHIQAYASGHRAGFTVADSQEALGLESTTDSDMELLRWCLRKRPVTEVPTAWPDYSLCISTTLIDSLTKIIEEISPGSFDSPPDFILSIGSGSGLLEAHLQSRWSSSDKPTLQIHGVEVRSADYTTPNRYLPFKNRSTVRGTWEVSSRLLLARVLLFVYPRQVELVKKYMDEAARDVNSRVRGVIWLGPRSDWDEETDPADGEGQQGLVAFKRCLEEAKGFGGLRVMDSREVGLPEYEMMAFVTKRT